MDSKSAAVDAGSCGQEPQRRRRRPPVPDVYRGTEGRPGPALFTLDVDGEWFAVRRIVGGGTAYDWLTGPNKGYGFASGGTTNQSVEEHTGCIGYD
jgi:hypothetical protein